MSEDHDHDASPWADRDLSFERLSAAASLISDIARDLSFEGLHAEASLQTIWLNLVDAHSEEDFDLPTQLADSFAPTALLARDLGFEGLDAEAPLQESLQAIMAEEIEYEPFSPVECELHSLNPVDRYLGEHRRWTMVITRRIQYVHGEDELDLGSMYTQTWTDWEWDWETFSLFNISECSGAVAE